MRLQAIRINNVLGVRSFDRKFTSPVVFIAGRNFSGKSSLLGAVRMTLLEEPERVLLKKDYGKLVTEGAKEGEVVVTVDKIAVHFSLPDGKATPWTERPPFIEYCLHADRFAALPPDSRRTMLFDLIGLKADGQGAMKRMVENGCEPKYVEKIGEFLKKGFPAAHTEAADRAREAKASWRTTTSEQWGSEKGAIWAPAGVPYGDPERAILQKVQKDLEQAQLDERAAGDALAKLEGQSSAPMASPGDPKKAARVASIKEDIAKAEGERDRLIAEQAPHKAALDAPASLACPHCGGMVVQDGFALKAYQGDATDKGAARAAVARYEESLKVTRTRIVNLARDLTEAQEHATRIAAAAEVKSKGPSPHEITKAEETYKLAQDRTRSLRDEEKGLVELQQRAAGIADKQAKADKYHAEITGWLAVADATAPDGIPAELVASALKPFNDRLREAATMTEWLQVTLGADMAITVEGRGYALLSESERWRVDAMLAYAIAATGPRFLMLDRLDVLDLNGRGQALAWLTTLVEMKRIDGALVCATLKTAPTVAGVESFWLEQGQVLDIRQAA